MKKWLKITLLIIVSLVVIAGIVVPLVPFMLQWQPAYGTPSFSFPLAEPLNVTKLSAYNTPDWGEPGQHHTGIDLIIEGHNLTKIISPCYGTVTAIESKVNTYSEKAHIMISVHIRVNWRWSVMIVFEPYSDLPSIHSLQLELINVRFGTKVTPGSQIGLLLDGGEYAHIHYTVNSYFKDVNPYTYSSSTAKAAFDEIAERTNSTIYYP
jgi:hypothetical protein